ncbi:MAG: hypothetical protein U9O50_02900 [Acidobacteriota bacterium]|nr:hypothetical protein [Acidobacteriota bacterium]
MAGRINQKRSKVWVNCLAMVIFVVVVVLISSTNGLLAQEVSEEVKMTAMIQYTLEYRFSKDLKVGDYVKYQLGEDEIELKVTKQEKGGVWIVEEFPGMKIHLLVDLKSMKLLKGFGFDEKGEKREATPLSDKKLAEVIAMFKNQMEQEGAYSQYVSWKKGKETEKVDVHAGSFTCVYIKPEYSEQHKKQIENYVKLMQKQGKSDAEIDAEISKNEPRLYFNKEVPRLLSMQVAIGWMPWIDIFEEVKGGLVESKGMSPLRLTAYSGQKK